MLCFCDAPCPTQAGLFERLFRVVKAYVDGFVGSFEVGHLMPQVPLSLYAFCTAVADMLLIVLMITTTLCLTLSHIPCHLVIKCPVSNPVFLPSSPALSCVMSGPREAAGPCGG
jgi:hypothetical protein